jgi:hypothetical protein
MFFLKKSGTIKSKFEVFEKKKTGLHVDWATKERFSPRDTHNL